MPVLLREAAALLLAGGPRRVVDGTLGLGGHAGEILGSDAGLCLLGIDRDGGLVRAARARLAEFGTRFMAAQGSYADLQEHMARIGWEQADGVLLDLGYCSAQVDDPTRGFSFNHDAPLDLRFAPEEGETAAALLERLTEEELSAVIAAYGEAVSYTHLRAHETVLDLVCRLLLEKKKIKKNKWQADICPRTDQTAIQYLLNK